MTISVWTSLLVLLVASPSAAHGTAISIEVIGVERPTSRIYAAACEKAHFLSKDFLKECVAVASIPAVAPMTSLTIEGVPAGRFAIMVFHDLNGNGRLDFNVLGVPTEPGGFSGGLRIVPAFEKAAMDIGSTPIAIQVKLRCLFC